MWHYKALEQLRFLYRECSGREHEIESITAPKAFSIVNYNNYMNYKL